MSARASVIRKIGIQHSSETRLVDDDNVIQAFSPYRPDQPLHVGILPGRAWSTKHLFDAQPCGRLTEYLPIVAVAITQEIPRSRVPREGLQKLLGRPLRRRMAGDREVHEPTAVMAKDYEHKQQAKCGGWNDEEISRDEILDVIGQKPTPGLGRRVPVPHHVLGYGCLRAFKHESPRRAVEAGCTPAGVGDTHPSNQFLHVCRDGRTTLARATLP